jgi:hypothetical protein
VEIHLARIDGADRGDEIGMQPAGT